LLVKSAALLDLQHARKECPSPARDAGISETTGYDRTTSSGTEMNEEEAMKSPQMGSSRRGWQGFVNRLSEIADPTIVGRRLSGGLATPTKLSVESFVITATRS